MRTFYRMFRKFAYFLSPILGLAVLFLLTQTTWAHLQSSNYFALRTLDYKEQANLKSQDLMKMAGIRYGMNLLSMDLQSIQKRLQSHPLIKDIRIYRKLPGGLSIQLSTHSAAAIVHLDHPYLINHFGEPISRTITKKQKRSLVTLTGFHREHYKNAPKVTKMLFKQALAIHKLYTKTLKLERYYSLNKIQYDPILGYILHARKCKLYIGYNRFEARLTRLRRVYQILWSRGARKIKYIHLNNERQPRKVTLRLEGTISVTELKNR